MSDNEMVVPRGNRLYQIGGDDLADLERLVPLLCEKAMIRLDDNESRTQIRRVKSILSDVRWNYGPWNDVTEISADPELPK